MNADGWVTEILRLQRQLIDHCDGCVCAEAVAARAALDRAIHLFAVGEVDV